MALNLACWCIEMSCPQQTSMPIGIVFIVCSVRSSNCRWAWILILQTNLLGKKSTFWHADVSRWLTLSLFMLVVIFVPCPCVFTTISSFFAFADKSLGRDGIKFDKLISVSSDLPHTASMPMGIVVISCVRPSVKLSMNLGFGIADKSLGRKVYILACQCIQITNAQFVYAYGSYCPSVRPFTTFPVFCTFADKSLGRNGIKFGMLMCPDDLSSADFDAYDYCCHFMHSSIHQTIHGIEFGHCRQITWKKWSTFWHADVSRRFTLSVYHYGYYCPSIHLFTTFSGFCAFAGKSLRRNDIKIGMLIYPDDLPLADIDADGYCCHLVHLPILLTMHGVEFGYCEQIAWKKWSTFWHANVCR